MWIFTPNSFLSVVAPLPGTKAAREDQLVVRARVKGDIEAIFGNKYPVEYTRDRDYAFRALIPRDDVVKAVADSVKNIEYRNFKNQVKNKVRAKAYTRVWGVMNDLQNAFGHGGLYNDPKWFT